MVTIKAHGKVTVTPEGVSVIGFDFKDDDEVVPESNGPIVKVLLPGGMVSGGYRLAIDWAIEQLQEAKVKVTK